MSSVLFVMTPNYVKGYKKEVSGFVMGALGNVGALLGSTIALAF